MKHKKTLESEGLNPWFKKGGNLPMYQDSNEPVFGGTIPPVTVYSEPGDLEAYENKIRNKNLSNLYERPAELGSELLGLGKEFFVDPGVRLYDKGIGQVTKDMGYNLQDLAGLQYSPFMDTNPITGEPYGRGVETALDLSTYVGTGIGAGLMKKSGTGHKVDEALGTLGKAEREYQEAIAKQKALDAAEEIAWRAKNPTIPGHPPRKFTPERIKAENPGMYPEAGKMDVDVLKRYLDDIDEAEDLAKKVQKGSKKGSKKSPNIKKHPSSWEEITDEAITKRADELTSFEKFQLQQKKLEYPVDTKVSMNYKSYDDAVQRQLELDYAEEKLFNEIRSRAGLPREKFMPKRVELEGFGATPRVETSKIDPAVLRNFLDWEDEAAGLIKKKRRGGPLPEYQRLSDRIRPGSRNITETGDAKVGQNFGMLEYGTLQGNMPQVNQPSLADLPMYNPAVENVSTVPNMFVGYQQGGYLPEYQKTSTPLPTGRGYQGMTQGQLNAILKKQEERNQKLYPGFSVDPSKLGIDTNIRYPDMQINLPGWSDDPNAIVQDPGMIMFDKDLMPNAPSPRDSTGISKYLINKSSSKTPKKFKGGGGIHPNAGYEVERGEVIEEPTGNPAIALEHGGTVRNSSNYQRVTGNKHSDPEGGPQMTGAEGGFVYSDFLKVPKDIVEQLKYLT